MKSHIIHCESYQLILKGEINFSTLNQHFRKEDKPLVGKNKHS